MGYTTNIRCYVLLTPTFLIIDLIRTCVYCLLFNSANMASFEVEKLLREVSSGCVVNFVFGHNPIGELI